MNSEEIKNQLKALAKANPGARDDEEIIGIIADWHIVEVKRIISPLMTFKNDQAELYTWAIEMSKAMNETLKLAGEQTDA